MPVIYKIFVPHSRLASLDESIRAEVVASALSTSGDGFVFNVRDPTFAKHRKVILPGYDDPKSKSVLTDIPKHAKAIPPDKWPAWAKAVGSQRDQIDAGVGDTIERLAGAAGRTFKAMFKKLTGQPCGCADRRKLFNRLYPYSP